MQGPDEGIALLTKRSRVNVLEHETIRCVCSSADISDADSWQPIGKT